MSSRGWIVQRRTPSVLWRAVADRGVARKCGQTCPFTHRQIDRTSLCVDGRAPALWRWTGAEVPLALAGSVRRRGMFPHDSFGHPDEPVLDVAEAAQGELRRGAGLVVPGVHKVGEGGSEHAVGDGQPVGEVLQPVFPVLGGLGGDDAEDFEGGFSNRHVGGTLIDEYMRQPCRVHERGREYPPASGGDEVSGVGAVGQGRVAGVVAVGGEDPVVAFGGDAAGEVGVGGDDRRPMPEFAELGRLFVGE